jgi:hypothetical protein
MRLERIAISQLRRLKDAVEFDGLDPGINLFVGPNESGKTTVVQAIRAAFLERHRSTSLGHLQPWGHGEAAPSVEIDFVWGSQRWELRKRFCKQPRCALVIMEGGNAHEELDGDAAEQRLCTLLGYGYPERGASSERHWGVPGLLWIEQGQGQEIGRAVEYAARSLLSALSQNLAPLVGSAGDALIDEVRAARNALLTSNTARPTGEYASARARCLELEARLSALRGQLASYREQVDRLAALREACAQDRRTRPWVGLRVEAQAAGKRLEAVTALEGDQRRDREALLACTSNVAVSEQLLAGFAARREEARTREATRAQARTALAELEAAQPELGRLRNEAAARQAAASARLAAARVEAQRTEVAEGLRLLDAELRGIDAMHAQAVALQVALQARRRERQAQAVDTAVLERLRGVARELDALAIRQRVLGTRLRFELRDGVRLNIDGEALSGHGERLLLTPSTIEIADVGTLQVSPGGEDIADVLRAEQRERGVCRDLLASLGVASLDEAEQRHEQCRTLDGLIVRDEALLEQLAPQGIEELAARQQLRRERREALLTRDERLPVAEATAEPPPPPAEAEAQERAADAALRRAEQAQGAGQARIELAAQALASAEAEWARCERALRSPAHAQAEQEAVQRVRTLQARARALEQAIAERHQRIDAANPELLRQDIERLERSARAQEQAAQQREIALAELEGVLATQGANGLEELEADVASEFIRAGRRRDELARRAEALSLLLERLEAARLAVTRRLQAPLQRCLTPYLQLLFGEVFEQAGLVLDDQLRPTALTRRRHAVDERAAFDALSFGAREQMALISRLAYADVLREAGQPTLLILDDALVHADGARLAAMKRILYRAAQQHQILLFTCQPDKWADLGVAGRELRAVAAGTALAP